jgi:serine protease Do
LTRGILSALRKRVSPYDVSGGEISFIQTDTTISSGNSGAPLFLGDSVIGIKNKIVGDGVEGLGFAIHINEVLNFLPP